MHYFLITMIVLSLNDAVYGSGGRRSLSSQFENPEEISNSIPLERTESTETDTAGLASPVVRAIKGLKVDQQKIALDLEKTEKELAKITEDIQHVRGDFEELEEKRYLLKDKKKAAEKAIADLKGERRPRGGSGNYRVGFQEDTVSWFK